MSSFDDWEDTGALVTRLKRPKQQRAVVQVIRPGPLRSAVVAVDDAELQTQVVDLRQDNLPGCLAVESEVGKVGHIRIVAHLGGNLMRLTKFVFIFAAEQEFGTGFVVGTADFTRCG